jgi:DNA invertase Pin-like site-specific DNA recombinase
LYLFGFLGNWSSESGKLNTRPQLAAAMHRAKVTRAKLLIAKLDRLSRNVAFIAALQESGVKFVCADMTA